MKLNTFADIVTYTKNLINETDPDDQIDIIVKGAINHSYMFDLCKIEPDITTGYVPVVNGVGRLPDDLGKIISISPELLDDEYRIGLNIISSRDVTFQVIYAATPEPMVIDKDEPVLSMKLRYLLTTYACSEYFNFKKKTDIASYWLGRYETQKKEAGQIDNLPRNIIDTTGGW